MRAIARTLEIFALLVSVPVWGLNGQTPCDAPTSTNVLRPFGPGNEVRFEPSAVVNLPGECAILVFSDGSRVLEAWQVAFGPDGLGAGELVSVRRAPGVVGLEAATWTADSAGVLVVTSGAFEGDSAVDQSREDRALILAEDETGEWEVADDLTPEWRRFLDRVRRRNGGWLKVEAIHALGERYLVGIRQFGQGPDRFDYGILVVVWDPREPAVITVLADPRSLTVIESGDAAGREPSYARTYGVSSLECSAETAPGRLTCYMLASAEAGPGTGDLKSRLLRFELEELGDVASLPGREVVCFWGKAEGLTLLEAGMALVVFDSDRHRKSGSTASGDADRLPLDDNQDWYWVGKVNEAVGPPWDGEPPSCVGP